MYLTVGRQTKSRDDDLSVKNPSLALLVLRQLSANHYRHAGLDLPPGLDAAWQWFSQPWHCFERINPAGVGF
jgi:hypothetical protein